MSLRDRFTTALDGVIGVFSPKAALERQAAREATEQFTAYRGARHNRITNHWDISSGSADYDLLPDLPTLRERSRELCRNDSTASSIVLSFVDNVVGTGIRAQSSVTAESLGVSEEQAVQIRRAIERAWNRWVPHADIARRFNFYDLQSMVMRSILVNGESIVIPVMQERVSSPYATALELVEPDRLEYPGEYDNPNGRTNRRSGVELGRNGNPVAYWIRVSHPGDGIYERQSDRRHRRIRALDPEGFPQIYHLMNNTRPGQTRGEPMLSPALQAFKDLASFKEAVLVRERVSACFSMFIQKDDPYTTAVNRADEQNNAQRIQEIEPGMVSYLAPGESVTFGNPGSQSTAGYDAFVTQNLRDIGAAIGLPLELVSRDFSQTNYSSARAAILEARRVFNRWQRYVINHLCQPTFEKVIEEAYLRGEIPIQDFDSVRHEITQAHWVPPAYGWVDPLKEVQASALAIETGISSLAVEASAQGRDWEEINQQRIREVQAMQDMTPPETED